MLQKGRRVRSLSIILFASIPIVLFSSLGAGARTSKAAYTTGIMPVGGAASVTLGTPRHPFVAYGPSGKPRPQSTRTGATISGTMNTAAAAANPDIDLMTNVTGATVRILDPSTAPAGSQDRVVFVSDGADLDSNGLIDATLPVAGTTGFNGKLNIWLMRPDGSEQIMVPVQGVAASADKRWPVFDPSGRLVTYSCNATGRWEIYNTEISTGTTQCLTSSLPGNKVHPAWSPDGLYIAYSGDVSGTYNIYSLPSSGAPIPTQLTTDTAGNTEPTWSPTDTAVLLYTHMDGAVTHIYSINPSTRLITQITNGAGDTATNDSQASFSRDGTQIAFASTRNLSGSGSATGLLNVWREASAGEAVGGAVASLVVDSNYAPSTQSYYPAWLTPLSPGQPLRVFYLSTRSTPVHIWRTMITDVVPPIMTDLPWVDATNRLVSAGSSVAIHAQLRDDDTGVAQVFVRIKDPDRKLAPDGLPFPPAAGASPGVSNLFDASFTGPRYLEWDYATVATIQMYDDGNTAVDGDGTAGDGVYSTLWTTPTAQHDYVIDIIAIDNAGNQINYDSTYGFTTRPFTPTTNILFVNDFCEGQKFLYQYNQSSFDFRSNDFPAAWMDESYYTFNPSGLDNADYNSILGSTGNKNAYDTWRVICRGPVPPSVYQYYTPTVENQLDPSDAASNLATASPTKSVPVADRAVVWACPHAGDIWIGSAHPSDSLRPATVDPDGSGSLVDANTQAALGLFLTRGGRLFLSGEDIAWALTLNGTISNSFLTTYLHCSFVRDVSAPNVNNHGAYGTTYGYTLSAVNPTTDPVAFDPWVGSSSLVSHVLDIGGYDSADVPIALETAKYPASATDPTFTDDSDYSVRPDVISPTNTAEALYTYGTGGYAGIRYANASDPAHESRVTFLAFGFEQIHRQYHNPGTPPGPHCMNLRSHLMHNALCWSRTGAFQGKVLSISDGMKPITGPNPIVFFFRGSTAPAAGTVANYAVRCQDDGSYVINGITPGFYNMQVRRSGFEIDHFDGEPVHGGWAPVNIDFTITRPRPAAITGQVTSQASGAALASIWVRAYLQPATGTVPFSEAALGTPVAQVQTDAAGNYTLSGLPVDPSPNYVVIANDTLDSHTSNTDYGSSVQTAVTLVSGSTSTVNLTLPAAPGALTVHVQGTNPNPPPATLNLVASVQLTNTTTSAVVVSGTTTLPGGTLALSNIPPGTYSVAIASDGYQPQTVTGVTISPNVTTDLGTITLTPLPPGKLSGRITSATTGLPVPGIVVNIIGASQTYTTTTYAISGTDTTTPNYILDPAPTGTYTVQPVPNGFTATPTQRTGVVVTSGNTTSGVNFVLSALHTFAAQLLLMSTPNDYSGIDPATLLNIDPTTLSGEMATWVASASAYRTYPLYPADAFYPGRGYWLKSGSAIDIRQSGAAVSDPFVIHLGNGWNMVGSPYDSIRIDLYQTTFTDTQGTYSFRDALASGKLTTLLYAYVLGGYRTVDTMTPWVGYWLHTSEALDMTISHTMGTAAAQTAQDTRAAVAAPDGGWVLPISATAGGLVDSSTYIGMAPKAAAAFKPGVDMLKPPPATMAPYVYAALSEQSWGSNSGAYAVDVRPSDAGGQTWDLKVSTNQVGADVTVSWPDMTALPANVRPVLVDVDSGRKTYMRTTSAYTFQATDAERHLQVVIDTTQNAALTVTGVNTQQATGAVTIAYTLSCAASVDVQIRNISGVLVRRVTDSQLQTAGTNQTLWNCRNDAGRLVPAGRYLVTLKARTDEGQEINTIVGLVVGR